MTPEELDKARASEAWRILGGVSPHADRLAETAARLAREGWTPPPPPVDPDLLAVREIVAAKYEQNNFSEQAKRARKGAIDDWAVIVMALAAYKAGKEAEAERAKALLEYAEGDANRGDGAGMRATQALAAYKAGKEAGK
jgi:hypothetical protein